MCLTSTNLLKSPLISLSLWLAQDPESAWDVWQEEYKQVVSGFDQLHHGPGCGVDVHPGVGLAIATCPDPLHYYSIFSHTCGCDYVLTLYAHNRQDRGFGEPGGVTEASILKGRPVDYILCVLVYCLF